MASKPSSLPEVTLHKGEFTMDDVLKWESKISLTEGQKFTIPTPGDKNIIVTMAHSSEFPFEGAAPTSPLPLSSPEAKAMDQSVIVPDEFEIKPIDSKNPDALQNRRHRTFAKTAFDCDGNQVKFIGHYAEVTSTEFVLKDNSVIQIGGLKDEATSQCVQNFPNLSTFKLVNSWRFGGGKYLGAAEGNTWGPCLLGPFGLLFGLAVAGKFGAAMGGTLGVAVGGKLGAAVGGEVGKWFTPPNYASCSAHLIPPADNKDGVFLANITYQPLATHHFAFKFSTKKWQQELLITRPATTMNPPEAINLISESVAFSIAQKDGELTLIKPEKFREIAKQHDALNSVENLMAIENKNSAETINHYLENFNHT